MSIHKFTLEDISGKKVELSDYEGKVLLIVNTATKCGFTPQFSNLETLYNKYKDQEFEILAFPSNDFAKQEPRDGNGIKDFCEKNYNVSFKIFAKINVKGKKAHPLFRFLRDEKTGPKWNFHKYLIDKTGNVVDHFYTFTKPDSRKIQSLIEKLLNS